MEWLTLLLTWYHLPSTNRCICKSSCNAKEKVVFEGIKAGRSMLTGVVDLVNSVPMDYMHCVLEGVTKWLV